MNELQKAREDINRIDLEMVRLFEERMAAVESVARYKAENDLPIFDKQREHEVIEKGISHLSDKALAPYYESFQNGVMATSRAWQKQRIDASKRNIPLTDTDASYRCYHLTLPDCSYDIHFERGGLSRVAERFSLNRRVLVLTDSGVPAQYAQAVAAACKEGYILTVNEGEDSKSLDTLKTVEETLLTNGFTRHDALVAVGGGVVGDLGGFAASMYMRGIDFYNVPTTVLSMVDSSVG